MTSEEFKSELREFASFALFIGAGILTGAALHLIYH